MPRKARFFILIAPPKWTILMQVVLMVIKHQV